MRWSFQSARDAFDKHRDDWDQINHSGGDHILLDSAFVAALVRHMAGPDKILAIAESRDNPAMAVLEKARSGFWETYAPGQGPLGLAVFKAEEGAKAQIYSLIRRLPGYTLGVSIMQQDPDHTIFRQPMNDPRMDAQDYIQTARLTLLGTYEEYWKTRGKNLTHNLARQRRRLAEQGTRLEFVESRDATDVAECVQEHARLEQAGWKAARNSAIGQDDTQGRFYSEILRHFCSKGEAVIYRLLMNGQTIASDLCLERNGMMVILKTAYDEGVKNVSPGLLLHQEVFRSAFSGGRVKVVEFYGRIREWHQRWTEEARTMYHVTFYRHAWVARGRRFWRTSVRPAEKEVAS